MFIICLTKNVNFYPYIQDTFTRARTRPKGQVHAQQYLNNNIVKTFNNETS